MNIRKVKKIYWQWRQLMKANADPDEFFARTKVDFSKDLEVNGNVYSVEILNKLVVLCGIKRTITILLPSGISIEYNFSTYDETYLKVLFRASTLAEQTLFGLKWNVPDNAIFQEEVKKFMTDFNAFYAALKEAVKEDVLETTNAMNMYLQKENQRLINEVNKNIQSPV